MSMTSVGRSAPRRTKEREKRDPEFVVRAKTGPSARDWTTLGYAWRREGGEGFSIKLNALPIGNDWGGVLKLLPPFSEEERNPEDTRM